MRRFIAIALLILVPLRVFGAEMVGLCMMQSATANAQVESAMPDDCPMMSKSAGESGQHKQGGGCQSCELCMPIGAPDTAAAASAEKPPFDLPAAAPARFRSAQGARALKPPIG